MGNDLGTLDSAAFLVRMLQFGDSMLDLAYETAAAARLSDMSGYAPLAEILPAVHTKRMCNYS